MLFDNKINKKIFFGVALSFLIGLSCCLALSVGGVSDKVEAYPGQNAEIILSIQNQLEGATNIQMEGLLEEGSEIVSFVGGNDYSIPAGGSTSVKLKISVPQNVPIGTQYPVTILLKTTAKEPGEGIESTGVTFVEDLRKTFQVKVIAKPEAPAETPEIEPPISLTAIILSLAILIVIVIILWLVIKNKKQEPAPSPAKSINPTRKK